MRVARSFVLFGALLALASLAQARVAWQPRPRSVNSQASPLLLDRVGDQSAAFSAVSGGNSNQYSGQWTVASPAVGPHGETYNTNPAASPHSLSAAGFSVAPSYVDSPFGGRNTGDALLQVADAYYPRFTAALQPAATPDISSSCWQVASAQVGPQTAELERAQAAFPMYQQDTAARVASLQISPPPMAAQGLPVRPHYFSSLLEQASASSSGSSLLEWQAGVAVPVVNGVALSAMTGTECH